MLNENEVYIIRLRNKYLVGCPYNNEAAIRFSDHKYDGYRTNKWEVARRIAKRIGGKIMKLNLLNGDLTGGW